MATLIFIHPAEQVIALIVGNNPSALRRLYSTISGRFAVLSTAGHGSGGRLLGDLARWLPGAQLPELMEAHKEDGDFLRSRGFTVGVDVDGDPLEFIRFMSELERNNRKRPIRYLLGLVFGDLFLPRTKPLAQQPYIERRLARLPIR